MYWIKLYKSNDNITMKVVTFLSTFFLLLALSSCKKEKQNDNSCKEVQPTGQLSFNNASGPFTFRTNEGGTIIFKPRGGGIGVSITHDDYPGFEIQLWGDTTVNGEVKTSANHENLNGKHIKDRNGTRRTIIFPDGAKITIVANGENGPLISASIYDGAESHRINPACNTLIHSSTNLAATQQLDTEEADGEAGGFEFTPGGLLFVNLYSEQAPGNKINNRVKLGEIFRNNPNQTNDFYDDPRLGHT